MAVDAQGNIFIPNFATSTIREIRADTGLITTPVQLSNMEVDGIAVDRQGDVFAADSLNSTVKELKAGTSVANTVLDDGNALSAPGALATDGQGNLYVADGAIVRRFHLATYQSTIVPGVSAYVLALAADAKGNLFILTGNEVSEVAAGSQKSIVIAGSGRAGFGGDGGPAMLATLNEPRGIALDADDNLYIADSGNNAVREVLASTGKIYTIAGMSGVAGYTGDGGPADKAELNQPWAIAVSGAGNLYISDVNNGLIRVIGAAGSLGLAQSWWSPTRHKVKGARSKTGTPVSRSGVAHVPASDPHPPRTLCR